MIMSMTPFDPDSLDESLLLFLLQNDNNNDLNSGAEVTLPQTNEDFMVRIDVQHFRPEELKVRLLDGYLVIEGRHDEKVDEHGTISRQFVRKYKLPEHVDPKEFSSTVSSDGVLTVVSKTKSNISGQLERKDSAFLTEGQDSIEDASQVFN
ncbi:unnamed protein product [Nezara viridula]|uniref:SHSP domain-containing protein n=1 Tax=Nezara viridula TaxID=85310 RepID=A0A9P0MJ13_NEZVI|nr:unnamed protein product [Nezara viridula]